MPRLRRDHRICILRRSILLGSEVEDLNQQISNTTSVLECLYQSSVVNLQEEFILLRVEASRQDRTRGRGLVKFQKSAGRFLESGRGEGPVMQHTLSLQTSAEYHWRSTSGFRRGIEQGVSSKSLPQPAGWVREPAETRTESRPQQRDFLHLLVEEEQARRKGSAGGRGST